MRQLFLGVSVLGFLAFVGVQAAHVHPGADHRDCQLCVLGAQNVRHASAAAVMPSPVQFSVPLADKPSAKPAASKRSETAARGPPAA